MKKGRQTSDESIIATFMKYFDTIKSHAIEVSRVLNHRLEHHPLEWRRSMCECPISRYI